MVWTTDIPILFLGVLGYLQIPQSTILSSEPESDNTYTETVALNFNILDNVEYVEYLNTFEAFLNLFLARGCRSIFWKKHFKPPTISTKERKIEKK